MNGYSAPAPAYESPGYGYGDASYGFDGGYFGGRGFGLSAGGGVYYLRPSWERNPAFLVSMLATPEATLSVGQAFERDFHFDNDFSPRVWASYVFCGGLGVRGRYWHYEEEAAASVINTFGDMPANPSMVIVSAEPLGLDLISMTAGEELRLINELKLDVYDLEATYEGTVGCWSMLVSGGVRYVQLEQAYEAYRGRAINNPDQGELSSTNRFQGLGPTASLEFRKMCWGGLSLYTAGRGSILFGDGTLTADLDNTAPIAPGGPLLTIIENRVTDRNDLLPVLEFELGLEYTCNLSCYLVFVQAAYVGQTWFGAGSATSEEGNLGFNGFTLTAGFAK